MADVTIPESIWSDPKFWALARELGSQESAIGQLIIFWRMAQEYDDGEIPFKFCKPIAYEKLILCDWAWMDPEQKFICPADED